MKSHWLSNLRGYVRITIRGKYVERLINLLYREGMEIWDIRRTDEGMELCIHLNDFFQLRSYLKQTGCRVHVLERYGLPFFLDRMERRKVFAIGLIGFITAIYVLSSLIWQVDVKLEGKHKLSEQTVKEAAHEVGIREFQWKFRLSDPDTLSRELQALLPDTSWVGVEVKGTNITIKVIESVLPEDKPLYNPRHLVSVSDAVVTKIIAESGKPVVSVNTRVKKGDILISGIIGDEENQEVVIAKGEVKGLVWHEFTISLPLKGLLKGYTGEKKDRWYIAIGERALRISGFGKMEFDRSESEVDVKELVWRNWKFPVRLLKETVREVQLEEQVWSAEEAEQIGIAQAKAQAARKYGSDSSVENAHVLSRDYDKEQNRLTMHVMFEINRDIAEERAILSEELKKPEENEEA